MKFLIILIFIYSTESHINGTDQLITNRVLRQNSDGNYKVYPIVNEKMVYDTRSIDEEALQLLLKNIDQEENDIHFQSEESSGDFEPSNNRLTHRRAPSHEPVHPPNTHSGPEFSDRKKKVTPNSGHFHFENGWIQFKYEKAYILVNQTATRVQAEHICRSFNDNEDMGAELAVPESDEEMSFINHYMFNMSHCLKNVWIGQNTNNYRNASTEFVLYSHWAKGKPTMTKPCVQIRSPYTIYADMDGSIGGKWEDVSCYRKNLVLCQKPQHWSEHQFIRVLTELKKDVEGFKRKTGADVIPPGFTYIQLPHQATPRSLWPKYEWKEISTHYSGLFFRVIGGKSAAFGSIQESTSPKLNGFKSYGIHGVPPEDIKAHSIKADNRWTDKSDETANGYPISFRVSDDEVVPRNTAIKVWKRV